MVTGLLSINCDSCATNLHDELKVKRHAKSGHTCDKLPCPIESPHGHRILSKIFPLEEKIRNLKTNNHIKQFLINISYLTPALITSNLANLILTPLHGEKVTPFIASPLTIASMFLSNKGVKKLNPLTPILISLGSIINLTLQRLINMPKQLTRPFMALAVHIATKFTKEEHVHEHPEDKKHHSHSSVFSKEDLIKQGRLQILVNVVPWINNILIKKLEEVNHNSSNFINKYLGKIGIMATQILGLSTGFSVLGYILDKGLEKLKLIKSTNSSEAAQAESVCACCGAPVCVAEAASEASSALLAA